MRMKIREAKVEDGKVEAEKIAADQVVSAFESQGTTAYVAARSKIGTGIGIVHESGSELDVLCTAEDLRISGSGRKSQYVVIKLLRHGSSIEIFRVRVDVYGQLLTQNVKLLMEVGMDEFEPPMKGDAKALSDYLRKTDFVKTITVSAVKDGYTTNLSIKADMFPDPQYRDATDRGTVSIKKQKGGKWVLAAVSNFVVPPNSLDKSKGPVNAAWDALQRAVEEYMPAVQHHELMVDALEALLAMRPREPKLLAPPQKKPKPARPAQAPDKPKSWWPFS